MSGVGIPDIFAQSEWPKFKVGKCDSAGDGKVIERVITRAEAVELHGEQTVRWLETGQIAASQSPHDPEGRLMLWTKFDAIREAAPELLNLLARMVRRIDQGERLTPDLRIVATSRKLVASLKGGAA